MIVIQSSNIHQGGGAVLLTDILNFVNASNIQAKLFVDSRSRLDFGKNIEVVRVDATVFSRFKIEIIIAQLSRKNKSSPILFFGNLPPLFKSTSNAYLFFQNLILLGKSNEFAFSFSVKLKHFIERLWLKTCLKNINTVYVQSESVKRLFLKEFPNAKVKVLAFSNVSSNPVNLEKKYDFVYIASSAPHKNHLKLIQAWSYLFENGIRPKLTLTASNFSKEENKIFNTAIEMGVNIEIKSNLSHADVLELYSSAKALIYPSFTESFGLPLLEAKKSGLPIIASELDYVRDLVEPVQTFDPNSEVSIARAVQRFLNLTESAKTEVKTAAEFINEILSH